MHRARRTGRAPSKSLTLDQAGALLMAADNSPMRAYIVLSLLSGARTEEVRVVDAVTAHRAALDVEPAPESLVFGTRNGTELDRHNVLRASVGSSRPPGSTRPRGPPRKLRHSFVSLLSQSGVRIEDISRLVGHSGTAVTERVYRHELRPVLQEGAAAMDALFRERPRA